MGGGLCTTDAILTFPPVSPQYDLKVFTL